MKRIKGLLKVTTESTMKERTTMSRLQMKELTIKWEKDEWSFGKLQLLKIGAKLINTDNKN